MSEYPPGGPVSRREASLSEQLKSDASRAADFFEQAKHDLKAKGVSVEALERADDEMGFILKSPAPHKTVSDAINSGALYDALDTLRTHNIAPPPELGPFLHMFDAGRESAEFVQVALAETDAAEGRTARVNPEYKPKSSKDQRRKRRGTGGSKRRDEGSASPVEGSEATGDIAQVEEKLNTFRDTFDTVYSAALKTRQQIANPSEDMQRAWERYVSAVEELNAHEDAHAHYTRDAAGVTEATKELQLLKSALSAAEGYLTLASSAGKEAPVMEKPERDTAAEKRQELRSKVEAMKDLAHAQERLMGKEDAEGIQRKYFAALETHNKKRNILSVAGADIVGDDALTPKRLKEMRREWIASRAALARTMRESVDARMEATPSAARDALLERMKEKYGASEQADIHARYERRYGRNIIILDAERGELEAKERGLSNREKNILDSVYDRYKKLPAGVRILSTSALMLGAGAALAGTPVGWAALGMAGTGVLTRWGAMATKSKILGAAATGLSVAGIVGLGLEKLTGAVHTAAGTKKRAKRALKQTEGFGDLGDVDRLEKVANQRKKALVVDKNIARHRRWARVLGSVGAGWLLGHSGGANASEAGDQGDSAADTEATAEASQTSGDNTDSSAAPESQTNSGVPERPNAPEHVAVIDRGEGFNTLFADLQSSLREAGDTSPLAERLAEMTPTELSDLVNAYDPETGGSMVMQEGDRLYIDNSQNLVFERGDSTQVLMEVQDGQVVTHAFEDPRMMGMHAVAESVRSSAGETAPAAEAEAPAEPIASTEPELVTAAPEAQEEVSPVAPTPASEAPAASAQEFEGFPRATLMPQTEVGAGTGTLHTRPLEDYSETAESDAGGMMNAQGVEVLASEPHVYALPLPGSGESVQVVFGGSESAVRAEAMSQLESNPAAELYVTHTEMNPNTGAPETYLGMWHMNEEGLPEFEPVVTNPETGARLGAADPEQFIRRIN